MKKRVIGGKCNKKWKKYDFGKALELLDFPTCRLCGSLSAHFPAWWPSMHRHMPDSCACTSLIGFQQYQTVVKCMLITLIMPYFK